MKELLTTDQSVCTPEALWLLNEVTRSDSQTIVDALKIINDSRNIALAEERGSQGIETQKDPIRKIVRKSLHWKLLVEIRSVTEDEAVEIVTLCRENSLDFEKRDGGDNKGQYSEMIIRKTMPSEGEDCHYLKRQQRLGKIRVYRSGKRTVDVQGKRNIPLEIISFISKSALCDSMIVGARLMALVSVSTRE